MFSFFKQKKTDPQKKLKKILGSYKLPSFPATVTETLSRIRNPDSSIEGIADIISVDPGLSANVLRFANSAAFSPTQTIDTIVSAVTVVGLSQLETMVLSVGVTKNIPKQCSSGFDAKLFWRSAAKRAILARSLTPVLCPSRDAESFAAGLLQDMAIPFLAQEMPDQYDKIFAEWKTSDQHLHELETEQFGWDHAEVATWICSEWNLPENIASAIGGHHDTENSVYDCPPSVSISSLIQDKPEENDVEKLIELATSKYGMASDTIEEIIETSFENSEELFRLIV